MSQKAMAPTTVTRQKVQDSRVDNDSPGPGRTREHAAARRASRRLPVGLAVMLATLAAIGVRLVVLQGLDLDGMSGTALDKRLQRTALPASRGKIVDSRGTVLASSVVRYNITVDQRVASAADFTELEQRVESGDGRTRIVTVPRDEAIRQLADALGRPVRDVTAAVTGDRPFNYVARNVTPDTEDRVMAIGFPGVFSEAVAQRVYPNGAVGGNLIGFVGSDGTPLAGIEQTQDSRLQGRDGERIYEIGADGLRIPVATHEITPAQDGKTVRLTINSDLQYFTQQAIQTQTDKYSADWGIAIVMDARNGKILAMADTNTVDPNDPGRTAAEDRGSRAVAAAYEPGSVEKALAFAALIEEGKATPFSAYTIPPTYTIDGQTFADAFTHGTEHRTLAGILGHSMNTGTVMAGKELTPQQRYDWLTKFGIGQPVDIGLPGQAHGTLHPPHLWDARQQHAVLFGQGLTRSTLQTVRAYQALANDGLMLPPRLIDAYLDKDGSTETPQTASPQQVISKDTAQQVKDMLESNVTVGKVGPAAIDGYRVGAKTGTSEAPREDGVPGFEGVTSSLIGMAPMEDPRFIVMVVLQRPANVYGIGNADTFRSVMTRTLHMYGVPPSTRTPAKLPQYAQ